MAPVGSYESLRAAIAAGANSVYFGIGQLNMRSASAANFTADDMAEINRIAHENGVKTYLTVNTIIYDTELQQMHDVVDRAKAEGVDAIIASDMSVILYAYQVGVEVHISTQCNISNSEAVKFYSQWADVVVLARELSLEQIAMVHKAIVEQALREAEVNLIARLLGTWAVAQHDIVVLTREPVTQLIRQQLKSRSGRGRSTDARRSG